MKFEYGTRTIEFTVEYRRRKTFEIGVGPPDVVAVIAPYGADEESVIKAVKSKAKWITQKLFELREIEHRRYTREYVNGESFMYLGRNYSLQIIMDESIKNPNAKLYQGKFYITSPTGNQEKLKAAMEAWYRKKTLEKVNERVEYYQKHFSVEPNAVNVKEQKKRWGSCSAKRNLNFNWRCVMAPSAVLDYIVVHEMCHMVCLNHSNEFWALVKRIMPDYEKRREWLKNYGIRMEI